MSNLGMLAKSELEGTWKESSRGLVCCMPYHPDTFLEGNDLSH